MDRRYATPSAVSHDHDPTTSPDNPPDSPTSGDDVRAVSDDAPSPKKSKRSAQKRVVSVPIGDVDGSRSKGEGYPPSDSWAWRKYGQKPIKGSPYPRGYYRCSSSKGCPARKQVERSRLDPTMMLITYAFDHNHPFPPSKLHHHSSTPTTTTAAAVPASPPPPPQLATVFTAQPDAEPADDAFPELGDDSMLRADDFGWFSDVVSASTISPTVLESPALARSCHVDADMVAVYSMGEEEDSLFADLGELPECAVVFRRSFLEQRPSRAGDVA